MISIFKSQCTKTDTQKRPSMQENNWSCNWTIEVYVQSIIISNQIKWISQINVVQNRSFALQQPALHTLKLSWITCDVVIFENAYYTQINCQRYDIPFHIHMNIPGTLM